MPNDKKRSFYAVASGHETGVYSNWSKCKKSVDGYSGARFKKFSTRAEAEAFVSSGGSRSHIATTTAGARVSMGGAIKKISVPVRTSAIPSTLTSGAQSSATTSRSTTDETRGGVRHATVYTDGACSRNGFRGSKAGYGIFWGDGDTRNVAEPLPGPVQTNNRAEYTAVNEAIKQAISGGYDSVTVRTDSRLIYDTYNSGWMESWKRRGWIKSDSEPVKNLDLVQQLDSLSQRIPVKIEHVRAHADDYGNNCADELAVEGASKR